MSDVTEMGTTTSIVTIKELPEPVVAEKPKKEILFDPEDPLEFCPRETRRQNEALHLYAEMGGRRSLKKLSVQMQKDLAEGKDAPTSSLQTLWRWSKRKKWQERVRYYDDIVRQERDSVVKEERDKSHKTRIQAAEFALKKALEGLAQVDTKNAKYQDATTPVMLAQRAKKEAIVALLKD